ncbi:unnamed protein product [Alopecurus aequalis]
MGGGEEGERVAPRLEMASLPIPDELLGEILLRLDTPADLVRASAGCVSFRRVAADRSFLRRYRKLHAPPLLGFLERENKPTSHSPSSPTRVVRDIRDGRVLLDRPMRVRNSIVVVPEVVVCDPMHRRYLLLPPITYDLAASVDDPILTPERRLLVQIFLVPTGDAEEAATTDETTFRVIWMTQCKTMPVAFVFSSNTGQWRAVPSKRWSDLSASLPPWTTKIFFYSCHYLYGCFYWATDRHDYEETKFLVLDIKTMKFSIAESPPEATSFLDFVMVESGGSRQGIFVLADNGSDLSYFIKQNNGGSSSQWQKVKTISLSSWAHLIHYMEKYLLLVLVKKRNSLLPQGIYKMDIETFRLEKVSDLLRPIGYDLLAYSNFPPSLLSSPTISSGVEKGPEKEMLEQGCAASSSAESPRLSE